MGQQSTKLGRAPARPGRWTLSALVLVAFALRLYNLGGLEFRFDEAISANVSGLGWEGALSHLRVQPFEHPPVYYLSLYPWRLLAGTSEFALRFYSVFWGTLAIPLFYLLGRRVANEKVGQLSALLAAISPFLVAYSQEARMYTLLPCLALAALLSYHNALSRDGRPIWWAVYALLVGIGAATHYYFVLIWVVTTLFLLLERPRHRAVWLWGMGVQALAIVVGIVWLAVSPGTRSSLQRVLQGETAFGLLYKLDKVMPTLLLSEIGNGEPSALTYVLAVAGWFLVILGMWSSRRGEVLSRQGWRLLAFLLALPIALSLIIPYGVLGRHLGYTLVAVIPFVALALVALQHRGRIWLTIGVLLAMALSTYGLVSHYMTSTGDFGQAMGYIDERGQEGDLVILTQPTQKPLADYYNREGWPVQYVPATDTVLTAGQADNALSSVARSHSRVWLGPISAWTADPEAYVDRWLASNAFQAEKVWFPDSSSVALFFTTPKALVPIQCVSCSWGGRIYLQAMHAGPLRVASGDAVRIRLDWRAVLELEERYAVDLVLVDAEGHTWARRRSEPCSGWCPTAGWEADSAHQDHHALLVPEGTPPGTYHLQVSWSVLDGGPLLPAEEAGLPKDRITLAQISVVRAQSKSSAPPSLPNPLQATFGGEVTLLGYAPADKQVRPGEILHLETHWRAEVAPSEDLSLVLSLIDRRGQVVTDWRSTPAASFYPTSDWRAGEYVRGQHDLLLPSTLEAGDYGLRIRLVSPSGQVLWPKAAAGEIPRKLTRSAGADGLTLADVHLVGRTRLFEKPDWQHPLDFRLGYQAHLLGYDLDQTQAYPGGTLSLVLYWAAGGPMVKPYKVFTHLLSADGMTRAQHDAPPGGGCCPTNTWEDGEIIVDAHSISLNADIQPGAYRLAVGMYDEEENTRLSVFDAGGQQLADDFAVVATVNVLPSLTAMPQATVTPSWTVAPPAMALPTLTPVSPGTATPRPEFHPSFRTYLPALYR